jgi:hypothetical protein
MRFLHSEHRMRRGRRLLSFLENMESWKFVVMNDRLGLDRDVAREIENRIER